MPKNSKNKPGGLYFSKALFEGLIFGIAYIRRGYVRREVCVLKSIGLDYSWKEIYRFCFVYFVSEGNFPSTKVLVKSCCPRPYPFYL